MKGINERRVSLSRKKQRKREHIAFGCLNVFICTAIKCDAFCQQAVPFIKYAPSRVQGFYESDHNLIVPRVGRIRSLYIHGRVI